MSNFGSSINVQVAGAEMSGVGCSNVGRTGWLRESVGHDKAQIIVECARKVRSRTAVHQPSEEGLCQPTSHGLDRQKRVTCSRQRGGRNKVTRWAVYCSTRFCKCHWIMTWCDGAKKAWKYHPPTKYNSQMVLFLVMLLLKLISETDTDVILGWGDFGMTCSNRYINNGAPIAMILCATLSKQCVFNCFPNYFLFSVTARMALFRLFFFPPWPRGWLPMCMCAWFCTCGDRRGGKHALEHLQKTTMSQGKLSPIFWVVFRRERYSNRGIGALQCGGALEMSMSCCMCEFVETARSLWRWHTCGGSTANKGMRGGTAQCCVVWCTDGWRLAHRYVLKAGTRAEVNVKQWHPCEQTTDPRPVRRRAQRTRARQHEMRETRRSNRDCHLCPKHMRWADATQDQATGPREERQRTETTTRRNTLDDVWTFLSTAPVTARCSTLRSFLVVLIWPEVSRHLHFCSVCVACWCHGSIPAKAQPVVVYLGKLSSSGQVFKPKSQSPSPVSSSSSFARKSFHHQRSRRWSTTRRRCQLKSQRRRRQRRRRRFLCRLRQFQTQRATVFFSDAWPWRIWRLRDGTVHKKSLQQHTPHMSETDIELQYHNRNRNRSYSTNDNNSNILLVDGTAGWSADRLSLKPTDSRRRTFILHITGTAPDKKSAESVGLKINPVKPKIHSNQGQKNGGIDRQHQSWGIASERVCQVSGTNNHVRTTCKYSQFQQLTECTLHRHWPLYTNIVPHLLFFFFLLQLFHRHRSVVQYTVDSPRTHIWIEKGLESGHLVGEFSETSAVILSSCTHTWWRSRFVETADLRRRCRSSKMTELLDAELLKDLRGLGKPPSFDGNDAEYQGLRFSVRIHMSLVSTVSHSLMDKCEVERHPISLTAVKALGEAHLKCCIQMYYWLALITKGSVRTLVRSVEESNGAEAWRLIQNRFAPDTQNRQYALMQKIMMPSKLWRDHAEGFESGLRARKLYVGEWERASGTALADAVKYTVMMNMATILLRNNM